MTVGLFVLAIGASLGSGLAAQAPTEVPPPVPGAKPVAVERIKVHATSLEGNLEGNAADRDVLVFLPPSYAREKSRRYPVVYALHGYSIGAEQWAEGDPRAADHRGRLRAGRPRDDRRPAGFEDGAQRLDVLEFGHDGRLRAVRLGRPRRLRRRPLPDDSESREPRPRGPLDGRLRRHAHRHEARRRVRQPLHHEPVLPVAPRRRSRQPASSRRRCQTVKTPADSATLPFFARAQLATAAAWSPNPKNPPLFLDLPVKDGAPQPDVLARWTANAPLAFVDQYIGNLRRYRAIAMDVGDQDGLRVDAGKLHDIFDTYGIANTLRDLPGHAHEQGGGPLPEPRDEVLQREPELRGDVASEAVLAARRGFSGARSSIGDRNADVADGRVRASRLDSVALAARGGRAQPVTATIDATQVRRRRSRHWCSAASWSRRRPASGPRCWPTASSSPRSRRSRRRAPTGGFGRRGPQRRWVPVGPDSFVVDGHGSTPSSASGVRVVRLEPATTPRDQPGAASC